MVKKTLGYVELEWTCPSCGTRNPGTEEVCQSCGTKMPEDIEFDLPAQQELDTSAETATRVATGPDIHCPYCETRNPAGSTVCKQCGGSLAEGEVRAAGHIVGAPPTARPPAEPRAAPRPVAPKAKGPWYIWAAGLAVLLLVCCLGIYIARLAMTTEDVNGVVHDVWWERRVSIEALQPVSHEDWRDEIPSDARLGNCQKKHHHTQSEEPSPGVEVEKACGTPYTIDQGSGYGKVVQDCQYKVYADWCQYTREEWQEVDDASASGHDLDPYWPQVNLASGQREGERSEEYEVNLTPRANPIAITPTMPTSSPGMTWTASGC